MSELFGEWLEEQYVYQRQSYGNDLDRLSEEERLSYIDEMLKAAILEVGEAYNEFSWKSWASAQFRNKDALTGDLVDVVFFVANALVANGVTSEELTAKYRGKMGINTERQIDGYDGISGKCPECRRALDDPAVTCVEGECFA